MDPEKPLKTYFLLPQMLRQALLTQEAHQAKGPHPGYSKCLLTSLKELYKLIKPTIKSIRIMEHREISNTTMNINKDYAVT